MNAQHQPEGGATLPLVVRPDVAAVAADWAAANRSELERELLRHGAILFRDFELGSIPAFERFASAVTPDLFGEYGDLPRAGEGEKVYDATPYPADKSILFHNESSHLHRWPMRQWFYCIQPAEAGGNTELVDCREMYRRLDPHLAATLAQKGLLYVRNFIDGIDVSWQDFFHTSERAEVERYCREADIEYEWMADDGLQTRRKSRAVVRHPQTGEWVFFNQIQLHHPACLEPSLRESMLAIFDESELPRNVYFGDGSKIADAIVDEIGDLYDRVAVGTPWRAEDVVLLDNMLVAHARRPYRGDRRITVALARMIHSDTLAPA